MFFGQWLDFAQRQSAFWSGAKAASNPSNCSHIASRRLGQTITPSSKSLKSIRFREFYLQQKCHCSRRALERIVLTVTRYD
jgi:hypothetical protein